MARLKSTPSRATKRKIQQRNVRDSLQVKSNKRLRLSNQSERFPTLSNRSSKRKEASLAKQSEDVNLPPELRKAGLLAHTPIPKGKCFGPFVGKIVHRRRPPDKKHFFVSEVQDNRGNMNYFYALKVEKEKCSWLSRLQSASSEQEQNIVAYNSPAGVCFEALKDISAREELMASFDESFIGTKCLDESDIVPISYITDENGKEITIVPLDEAADGSIVYVNPENGDEAEGIKKGLGDGEEDSTFDDGDEEEAMETDDDEEEDDDDNDDDYIPENEMKLARVSKRKLADDNGYDGCNIADIEDGASGGNDEIDLAEDRISSYSKTATRQVKKLNIKEITFVDEDDGKDSIKYQCSHCLEEFVEKQAASYHRTSKECLSRVFQCGTCTQDFKNASFLQKHKCGGKPKCRICDAEFEEWKQLEAHKNEPPAEHVPKCARCSIQFTSNKEKQYHVRHTHGPKETPQECLICHKSYNKTYLKEHMKTHQESDALKCKECGKVFSSKSNLNKHVKKHAPGYVPLKERKREKKHACSDCDKKFDTLHSLQVHQRSHTGERPFQCDKCEWRFIQKTHLRRHIQSVHERSEGDNVIRRGEGPRNTSVTCEVCQKIYVNHRVLVVHMQSVHLGERPHKCNYCDATYTQRGHLWRHMHASHFDADEVQKKYTGDKFCCNFDGCGEALNTQSDLVEHVRTHTTTKSCMCGQCGATFVSQGNLNKHTRRRHSGRPTVPHKGHSCEMCGKAFPTSYQLQLHFRSHTGEKPYHCDLCGKDFVQKAGLRKHIRCKRCPMIEGPSENPSSVVKKYACEHCEKMFPGPSDLRAHVRSHTGERPYQCNHCQKGFSQPGNLTKHIKYIHEKQKRPKEKAREKKFFCSLCGKAFLCPSSLAMHCRTHSGHKPFSCEQCGQAFAQAGNLKKHVKRWHEDGAGPWQRGVNKRKHERKSKEIKAAGSNLDTGECKPPVYSDLDAESDRAETTDTQDTRSTSDLTLAVPSAAYMNMNEGSCTPLNSLGVFVGTTPLNTPVTSGTNGATVQRQPVILGFVGGVVNGSSQEAAICEGAEGEGTGSAEQSKEPATDEHNTAAVAQAKGIARLSASSLASHQQNLYAPAVANPSAASQNAMASQQLQQIVLSRAFTPVTGIDSVFLPPNVAGTPVSAPSTVLQQVHTILNPAISATLTGVTPSTVLMAPTLGSDTTIFSFSPSNFFQQ